MDSLLEYIDKTMWSDIYAQLSEFFKEPTEEFADDIESGRLLGFFRERLPSIGFDFSLLNGLLLKGDVYAILSEEYRRLFIGTMPPYIIPVESVYKRWTHDPECNLLMAQEKGYLMGDPAIDMIKRYQAHGIVIPDNYSSMPDHIALELEYMSFLCRNASEGEQRDFIETRLDWLKDLAGDISSSDSTCFYASAIHLVTAVVRLHLSKLQK